MIYARCRTCGRSWGISLLQQIPKSGYVCPNCERKEDSDWKDQSERSPRAEEKRRRLMHEPRNW